MGSWLDQTRQQDEIRLYAKNSRDELLFKIGKVHAQKKNRRIIDSTLPNGVVPTRPDQQLFE